LPSKYKLIYPLPADLKNKYYYSPPIIAGNFKQNMIKGFDVYNLTKHNGSQIKIDSILDVLDDVYAFYLKKFPNKKSKPKIIFVPFKGEKLLGRTLEDVILLNSVMLRKTYKIQKRLLAHEMAHLWWGNNGIKFENSSITEGIAEFMAIQYMKHKKESAYLETLMNQKYYHCEGITDKSKVEKGIKNKPSFLYSYDFIPILLERIELDNQNIYNLISLFYKQNSSKCYVNIADLEVFLKANKSKTLIDSNLLPDYFITEDIDSVYINATTEIDQFVDVDFTDFSKATKRITLRFSKVKYRYSYSKQLIKKITIDNDFKTIQLSRLNDVWVYNDVSLFTKNRYFIKEEINDTVIKYATDVLNYIMDKDSDDFITNLCNVNIYFKSNLNIIKEKILSKEGFIPTGASVYYRKNKNEIYLKVVYYSKSKNESKVFFMKLYLFENLNNLVNIKLSAL